MKSESDTLCRKSHWHRIIAGQSHLHVLRCFFGCFFFNIYDYPKTSNRTVRCTIGRNVLRLAGFREHNIRVLYVRVRLPNESFAFLSILSILKKNNTNGDRRV